MLADIMHVLVDPDQYLVTIQDGEIYLLSVDTASACQRRQITQACQVRAYLLRAPFRTSGHPPKASFGRAALPSRDVFGEVAEWLKAPHSKCGILARVSWVQIPPSPPQSRRPTSAHVD